MNQHPNLKLVHRFFEAYANNTIHDLQDIFHDEIKWHIPGNHLLSGIKHGISEIVEYLNQLNRFNFKAEGIVLGANDDCVIDCHRNWSELEDENNLNNMSCLLWKFENGKI